MENEKKVYSQSLESIRQEWANKDGTRLHDYDVRMKRSQLNQVYYLANQKKENKKIDVISKLKIVMPITLIATLLTGGVLLVKHTLETKDILKINHFTPTSRRDITVSYNQKKAGDIIDLLTENNYQDINYEDIKFACDYIKNAEMGNYDKNGSSIIFSLDDYFSYKMFVNKEDNYEEQSELLEKIGKYHQDCFKRIDGRLERNPEKTKEFLDFTLSMIFMYDTSVDSKGSGLVKIDNQRIDSPYARQEDISTYQSLPLIVRYIIANQACTMLRNTNYNVNREPSNYHSGLSKYDLIEHLQKEMSSVKEYMENQILFRTKSM